MKFTYNQKAGIVKYVLPLIVIVPFAIMGYKATHQSHAQNLISGSIAITTDKKLYHIGQDVTVTLSNATNVNLYVSNNCPREPLAVEVLNNGQWQQIHETTSISKCSGEPRVYMVPSNTSIKTDYLYWPELFSHPGKYRIIFIDKDFHASTYAEFSVVN